MFHGQKDESKQTRKLRKEGVTPCFSFSRTCHSGFRLFWFSATVLSQFCFLSLVRVKELADARLELAARQCLNAELVLLEHGLADRVCKVCAQSIIAHARLWMLRKNSCQGQGLFQGRSCVYLVIRGWVASRQLDLECLFSLDSASSCTKGMCAVVRGNPLNEISNMMLGKNHTQTA